MVCLESSQTDVTDFEERQFFFAPSTVSSALDFYKTQSCNPGIALGSPAQVLHQMIVAQASGKVVITDPLDASVVWHIYVGKGEIHFATSLVGQTERLRYLQQYSDFIPALDPSMDSDYQFLCAHWQAGRMTLSQLRQVLVLITQDVLVQALKLPKALIRVEQNLGLDPLLMSVPLLKLLTPIQVQLRQWQNVPEIVSALQRPTVRNPLKWQQMIHDPGHSLPRLQFIAPLLEGQFCLYQVAQEMGMSLLEILPLLKVLIQQNVLAMLPYSIKPILDRPIVACIDANPKIQCSVRTTLNASGYDTVALPEPNGIWSAFTQSLPVILLIDIDQLDGHRFVKTLRCSQQFKSVPIVALTQYQDVFNRFWNRRLGVMDCLIKPFAPDALSHMMQRLVA